MIDCLTCETAHRFGTALVSQFRLRHRAFAERQGYDTRTFRGMEYDQYDTPASTYLAWRDGEGEVRGMSRLNPTDRPYMLRDLWPEMVTERPLPDSIRVWEGTRFCVDRELGDAQVRRRVISEVVLAYLEYGLEEGIEAIVGVMPPLIWRSVFVRSGWSVDFLGPRTTLHDGSEVVAGELRVNPETLAAVRRKTGVESPVLTR